MKKDKFIKGEYIVLLYPWNSGDKDSLKTFNQYYCYKQYKDKDILYPVLNGYGDQIDRNNLPKWTNIHYKCTKYWRYATKEEIRYYKRLGKPFDTLDMPKIKEPLYEIY